MSRVIYSTGPSGAKGEPYRGYEPEDCDDITFEAYKEDMLEYYGITEDEFFAEPEPKQSAMCAEYTDRMQEQAEEEDAAAIEEEKAAQAIDDERSWNGR